MNPIEITIIDGSPRKESETRKLIYLAKKLLEGHNAKVTVIDQGSQPLPLFDGDENSADQPSIRNFFSAVAKADVLILSSPEYHGGMSGAIKNALDWLTFVPKEKGMAGKVVGLMGGGGSFANSGASVQMMMAVRNMHGWLLPDVVMSVPQIWDAFNDAGELINPELTKRLDKFAQRLIETGHMFRSARGVTGNAA